MGTGRDKEWKKSSKWTDACFKPAIKIGYSERADVHAVQGFHIKDKKQGKENGEKQGGSRKPKVQKWPKPPAECNLAVVRAIARREGPKKTRIFGLAKRGHAGSKKAPKRRRKAQFRHRPRLHGSSPCLIEE